jgi:hypothetical protein
MLLADADDGEGIAAAALCCSALYCCTLCCVGIASMYCTVLRIAPCCQYSRSCIPPSIQLLPYSSDSLLSSSSSNAPHPQHKRTGGQSGSSSGESSGLEVQSNALEALRLVLVGKVEEVRVRGIRYRA